MIFELRSSFEINVLIFNVIVKPIAMPSNEELEDKIDSKYFEFLVNQKLNEVVREKYATYKGMIISVISVITIAMGYLSFDTISTRNALKANEQKVAHLDSIIQVSGVKIQLLLNEAKADFDEKSGSLDKYIESADSQRKLVEKQNEFLDKMISSSKDNLEGKDEIFSARVEAITETQQDIRSNREALDSMIKSYQKELALLDEKLAVAESSEVINRLEMVDSIGQRMHTLENEKSELFALHPGQTNPVSIKQTEYAILCNSIRLDESTIAVNGDTATLRKGVPHPLDSQQEGVFIVLVSSSRGGLLVKPIATYRVFVDHSQKNRWTSL